MSESIEKIVNKGISDLGQNQLTLFTHSNILHSYLISVKQLTGAETVTIFLQSKSFNGNAELIFHDGELAPVDELKTQPAAAAFTKVIQKKPDEGLIELFECKDNKGYILRISIANFIATQKRINPHAQRRKLDSADFLSEADEFVWLGLRFESEPPSHLLEILKGQQFTSSSIEITQSTTESLLYTLSVGGYMLWQHYKYFYELQDPVSRLPGRIELQAHLKIMLDEAFQKKQPVALILVNPDDFAVINQRFDREKGDQALAEIAEKLASCLRRSDALFRYGGAIFSVLIPHIGNSDVSKVAEKLRQSLTGQMLISDIRLTFSIGVSVYCPDSKEQHVIDVAEFLTQANQALNRAKISGGGCVIEWKSEDEAMVPGSFDRRSGIFTADTEKDYRNMQLLWETITVISTASETESIAYEFINRIAATLKPNRVALFVGEDEENMPNLLAAIIGNNNDSGARKKNLKFTLNKKQFETLKKVKNTKRLERIRFSVNSSAKNKSSIAYVVPLIARDNFKGSLYLDGLESILTLESSDLVFLNALATQVAMALDRAELFMKWKQEKERESRMLREEVRDLRQFVKNARMVYRSQQMESILETLRTVAPTDITVLITGESGTGKEVLAQTLHEYSDRKKKPLITVDCGAISQNLIESELFGHLKGAFTGAQSASEGRIVQASGGTLFLDEVGELPLDVQAKLLRFVQEKQITPVGGAVTRRVDARIVAATNRDLADEVAAGRFRGDLYYRLKVVTIKSPALRERPDDILPLAQHFLENFSSQYQKGNLRFSGEAEKALLEYQWPGNVRELQNTLINAVILSSSEIVTAENLQFSEQHDHARDSDPIKKLEKQQLVGGVIPLNKSERPVYIEEETVSANITIQDPWEQLRSGLEQQLGEVLNKGGKVPVPLGKWLNEDLVHAANDATNGNARRAAKMLGLAETTFRRQLEKVQSASAAGLLVRTASWSDLSSVFENIISSIPADNQLDIIDQARTMLLKQVIAKVPNDQKTSASIMGVTGPTYKRWLESLSE